MIAFDIDGCVNNIKEDIIKFGKDFFDATVTFEPSGYYLREIYKGATDEQYDLFWEKYGYIIYTNSPKKDFPQIVQLLRRYGIPACYITTRNKEKYFNNIDFDTITLNWLREYEILLPVHYRKDKDVAVVDYGVSLIVEDKPQNIEKLQKVTNVIIFDHPYNRMIAGDRIFCWKEFEAIIDKMVNH